MFQELFPVPTPALVLRHARKSAFLIVVFLAVATVAALTPAGPQVLGPIKKVTMTDRTMTTRAEYHPYYARKLGHRMARDHGWRSDHKWHCLRRLWNLESSWHVHADNPNSRAYGIPQALPGKKMSTAGHHWRRNAKTQIKWGIRYVRERYQGPCGAMHHKNSHGWY
jgi:hypothetical protein